MQSIYPCRAKSIHLPVGLNSTGTKMDVPTASLQRTFPTDRVNRSSGAGRRQNQPPEGASCSATRLGTGRLSCTISATWPARQAPPTESIPAGESRVGRSEPRHCRLPANAACTAKRDAPRWHSADVQNGENSSSFMLSFTEMFNTASRKQCICRIWL